MGYDRHNQKRQRRRRRRSVVVFARLTNFFWGLVCRVTSAIDFNTRHTGYSMRPHQSLLAAAAASAHWRQPIRTQTVRNAVLYYTLKRMYYDTMSGTRVCALHEPRARLSIFAHLIMREILCCAKFYRFIDAGISIDFISPRERCECCVQAIRSLSDYRNHVKHPSSSISRKYVHSVCKERPHNKRPFDMQLKTSRNSQ